MSNTATTTPRSQPARSFRQTQVLAKGCKNSIPGLENRVPPRSDLEYTRPKARRARPELNNPQLLEALLWMHTRRGKQWDDGEAGTITEVLARSWGEVQCRSAATHHLPSWFLAVLPGRIAYGCALFCYFVLASHRAGALGVLASYTELAALCAVSDRTVQRWVKRLETTGMVEVVQTWQRNPNAQGPKRGWWKHLYRPGPAMREIVGMGMLEGAKGLSKAATNLARRCARVARARLRSQQRTRSDALWRARNSRPQAASRRPRGGRALPQHAKRAPNAPSHSLDTLASPSPSPEGRGICPTGSPPDSMTSVTAAPPREEERPAAALALATPVANAPPRAPRRPADTHPGRGPRDGANPVPDRLDAPDARHPGPVPCESLDAWVEANEPPTGPEPPPPERPAAELHGEYVDPFAEQRKAFADARERRRKKFFGDER